MDLGQGGALREILAACPPSPGNRAKVAVIDRRFEEAADLYAEKSDSAYVRAKRSVIPAM